MKFSIQQFRGLTASVMVVLLASGCASRMDSQHPWDQAWRIGRVKALDDKSNSLVLHTDCRARLGRDWPFSRAAVVSYSYGGSPTLQHNRLVGVSSDQSLVPGDAVYVKIDDCSVPVDKIVD